jgi:hypothetical protein
MQRRFLFPVILLARLGSTQTCYWPDGSTNDYTPCPGVTDVSPGPCCSSGDACLQGTGAVGNCASERDGFLYRGACSDSSWSAPNCAQSCWVDESGGTWLHLRFSALEPKMLTCGKSSWDRCLCPTFVLRQWHSLLRLANSRGTLLRERGRCPLRGQERFCKRSIE